MTIKIIKFNLSCKALRLFHSGLCQLLSTNVYMSDPGPLIQKHAPYILMCVISATALAASLVSIYVFPFQMILSHGFSDAAESTLHLSSV